MKVKPYQNSRICLENRGSRPLDREYADNLLEYLINEQAGVYCYSQMSTAGFWP